MHVDTINMHEDTMGHLALRFLSMLVADPNMHSFPKHLHIFACLRGYLQVITTFATLILFLTITITIIIVVTIM